MATSDSTCSIEGCARPKRSRGMCNTHYENKRRYGHAIPMRDWSVNETLDYIGWDITGDGCWEWRGNRNWWGYGTMSLARKGLDRARAHRLMYERFVGPIPEGHVIRHKCDNPPCVNPAHLESGTQGENVWDMVHRGRHWRHEAEQCQNGHPITDPATYRIQKRSDRGDEKVCLRCQRERHLRWLEKKKLERAKLRDAS